MKKIFLILLVAAIFIPVQTAFAETAPSVTAPTITIGQIQTAPAPKTINVYIFTKQNCPHCATVKAQLEELKKTDYPGLIIHEFDMIANPEYVKKYIEFGQAYNSLDPQLGVPFTIVGEKVVHGNIPTEIRGIIELCNIKECKNPETIVADYLKANPQLSNQLNASNNKTIIGWIVISALIIAGVLLWINKKS